METPRGVALRVDRYLESSYADSVKSQKIKDFSALLTAFTAESLRETPACLAL